jgi:very-short-patch-repair endonuclease
MIAKKKNHIDSRGEVLVALLKEKADFAILQEQGWYRMPVANVPRHWPPKWLAFYQPKAFGDEAFRVQHYGEVAQIQVVRRSELFPNEFESARSSQQYYKLTIKDLETLDRPILSLRPRRLVFVPTTWEKFSHADQINDLFDDSPLEDVLWRHFKRLLIQAERQWELLIGENHFFLDFALFCVKAPLAVETDGDTWHTNPERANQDYLRQNAIESRGWHVMRFNSQEIREQMESYCLPEIQRAINTQGGLSEEHLVPRLFYPKDGAVQLSLFEESAAYNANVGLEENLEY